MTTVAAATTAMTSTITRVDTIDPSEDTMTSHEAAAYLGKPLWKIGTLRAQGELRAVRRVNTRAMRYRRADLDDYLDRQRRDTSRANPDPLLSMPEAAAYLNVSEREVWRLRERRLVETVKVGRHVRVRRSVLDAYTGLTRKRAAADAADPLLNVAEAAVYMNVPERMVYRLRYAGELAAVRCGRILKFRRSVLEKYLVDRSTPARAA
ncbi:helix-turn-helix domain-containing protein [Streptomyces sp. YPW6]|uniref:helix-turn-helix domain-containing protein n=1 Tax=Streptomyces sp. YPW6 TaxID=2840373 RepID=UPI003EBFACC1